MCAGNCMCACVRVFIFNMLSWMCQTEPHMATKEIISIKLHNVKQIIGIPTLNTICMQHRIIQLLTCCREVLALK